jgi:hypothetical protein
MVSPFAAAFAVVEQAARNLAGELATYRRGGDELEITLVVGSHPESVVDAGGIGTVIRAMDFLIAMAAIDFGPGPVPPELGDEIDRTVGAVTETYRVTATQNERGFRRSDPDAQTWRVHAKRVS